MAVMGGELLDILCNAYGIIDHRRPGQGVLDLAGAGFKNLMVDLTEYCGTGELESYGRLTPGERGKERLVSEYPQEMYTRFGQMLEQCEKVNLRIKAVRAPRLRRNTKRADLNELLMRLAQESIRICGRAGVPAVVIQPLFCGIAREEEWRINREYYLSLAEPAREAGVMILLENQCRDVNGHPVRGICADGRTAASWVDRLNEEVCEERFGFCLDTGVCTLCGMDMQEFAVTLGKRIKAVILRDCDRYTEHAMLPFTCVATQPQTGWLPLIRGLRQTGFDGWLIENFSDTAAAFSPLLRPGLIQLAKSVADYFQWQVEIENLLRKYSKVVLFGAGNMCRNYMKCYGKKYPPLFTCDNNSGLWGTQFCGLEVKPPESLKELPADCAVFICNIYYREIEKQLRDMGVTNPIAFFNDEYMPDYYYERLEDGGK